MIKNSRNYIFIYSYSIVIYAAAISGYLLDNNLYSKFIGNLSPIVVYAGLIIFFIYFFLYLKQDEWVFISPNLSPKIVIYIFVISMLMGCIPIIIDLWKPFGKDINTLFPYSLIFYPTIGFLAEMIFHILPILILSGILKIFSIKNKFLIIISAAFVEPIFQVIFGMSNEIFTIKDFLVGMEVFLFSLFQLIVFSRYGFIYMYISRIGFYISWHIIWGYFRLIII